MIRKKIKVSFNKKLVWSNLIKNKEVDPIFTLNQFWIILKTICQSLYQIQTTFTIFHIIMVGLVFKFSGELFPLRFYHHSYPCFLRKYLCNYIHLTHIKCENSTT